MKKAILAALVTGIRVTEFEDGQQVVKVGLEDGFSFNLGTTHPLAKKLAEGYEVDITYSGVKENESEMASGAKFTFSNLQGVKVIAIRPGKVNEEFASLPDHELPTAKKVGGGTSSSSSVVGKV